MEAVQLAKAGQLISISLRQGSVELKTVGTAMEAGCYGQSIRVKNEETHDVLEVTLTGPQTAMLAAN